MGLIACLLLNKHRLEVLLTEARRDDLLPLTHVVLKSELKSMFPDKLPLGSLRISVGFCLPGTSSAFFLPFCFSFIPNMGYH